MAFVEEEKLRLDEPFNHEVGQVEELGTSTTKKNCCSEVLGTRVFTVEEEEESSSLRCVESGGNNFSGPMTVDRQHEPSLSRKERQRNTGSGFNVEVKNRARKKINFETEERMIAHLGRDGVKSADIIDISDSEDEKEISPHTGEIGGEERPTEADNVNDRTSKKCLKGPFSDQRGEEYDDGFEEDSIPFPLSSTPRRKRPSRVLSDSESEDEDRVPIGKLIGITMPKLSRSSPCTRDVAVSSEDQREEKKSWVDETSISGNMSPKRKRPWTVLSDTESEDDDRIPIGELFGITMPKLSPSSPCTRDVAVSSEGQNVEEFVTPSRRRLLSLRECEEKKSRVTSNNVNTGALPQEEYCDLTSESEKESEEAASESEGESSDGFLVPDGEISDRGDNSCESSDSGDSSRDAEDMVDSDVDYDQILGRIGRRKPKKSKWQDEGDMLPLFGKDPILCMKAVCALYRQQTAEEKSVKGSLDRNGRGFGMYDAHRGTYLAEFLTDGCEDGDLVKSVEELEMFHPGGLEVCRDLACRYSKQLFTIYQNKEDPLFGPSVLRPEIG